MTQTSTADTLPDKKVHTDTDKRLTKTPVELLVVYREVDPAFEAVSACYCLQRPSVPLHGIMEPCRNMIYDSLNWQRSVPCLCCRIMHIGTRP
jgi:hypothetical protein